MSVQSQDSILFQSVKQGNRLAFQNLFTAYYEPLCQFAVAFLGKKEEAEEVVGDVFFSIWKNRVHITIEHSVKAYLYTCVKHAAIALARKNNLVTIPFDKETLAIADESHPVQQLEYTELHHYFQQSVDRLPVRCRQIFMLNRFENLRYKEISELLNISEKTVENQIIKALGILRQALHRYLREIS